MSKPEKAPLDAAMELAIREEVEARVDRLEATYWKFGALFAALVGVFFVMLWKISASEIRQDIESQLAETAVNDAKARIMADVASSESMNHDLTNLYASVATNQQVFLDRLNDMKQQDNVVLDGDFQKYFVVQTITNFTDGNKIILDYDPIPHTVRLHMPHQAAFDFSMDSFTSHSGKTYVFTNFDTVGASLLVSLTNGTSQVIYVRKSDH